MLSSVLVEQSKGRRCIAAIDRGPSAAEQSDLAGERVGRTGAGATGLRAA
jgi:hypothetical protein